MNIDVLATPRGTYVLVNGTVYRRTALELRRYTEAWMRYSVPASARPGKRCRMKAWYEVGKLPPGAEVITEDDAERIRSGAFAVWTRRMRDAAAGEIAPSAHTSQGDQQ